MAYKESIINAGIKKKQQWVIGLLHRSQHYTSLAFMVKDRTKDILYHILRQHFVRKRKTVTDEAEVYKKFEGYECETLKHKTEFVS